MMPDGIVTIIAMVVTLVVMVPIIIYGIIQERKRGVKNGE